MKKAVITGANGFIGKNLAVHLKFREDIILETITRDDDAASLEKKIKDADIIFHLAGVNRPANTEEFEKVNTGFTRQLLTLLEAGEHPFKLVFASSAQAVQDNPYGKSKLAAEEALKENIQNGELIIYRLPGVFGKWCRPGYNSVVATFCHNVATGVPLEIRDPAHLLQLVYIDDVIKSFVEKIPEPAHPGATGYQTVQPEYRVSLGELADIIQSFKRGRDTLLIPQVGDGLQKALYSSYLTYLPQNGFSYPLQLKTDNRGSLFELLKSAGAGQLFVSTTLPGITRGNHFHHTKTEKFLVIQGEGLIKFRSVNGQEIIEYPVSGVKPEIVDIPPGYTHNITNTGQELMITLFWANEIFNTEQPDTFFEKV